MTTLTTWYSVFRHCTVKARPLATSFLGLHVEYDRHLRTLALSYPGYVDSLLARLRPEGVRSTDTPSIYTPPRFGSTAPQSPTVDPEPPASTAQRKDIQVAIGYLMYYGRLVDSRILQATCALASEQSTATLGTMKRLERLLGFVSGHRLGKIIFHASDMLLSVLSNASYLSRPLARSVAGSFHRLTRLLRPGLPPPLPS